MTALNLSIPEFAMLLLMTQLNLSSWQARDAFWQKLTLKMLLGSYQLVQTITICLECSGGGCITMTGVCLWDVLALVSLLKLSVLQLNRLLERN